LVEMAWSITASSLSRHLHQIDFTTGKSSSAPHLVDLRGLFHLHEAGSRDATSSPAAYCGICGVPLHVLLLMPNMPMAEAPPRRVAITSLRAAIHVRPHISKRILRRGPMREDGPPLQSGVLARPEHHLRTPTCTLPHERPTSAGAQPVPASSTASLQVSRWTREMLLPHGRPALASFYACTRAESANHRTIR